MERSHYTIASLRRRVTALTIGQDSGISVTYSYLLRRTNPPKPGPGSHDPQPLTRVNSYKILNTHGGWSAYG